MWNADSNNSTLGLAVWHDDHGTWSIDAGGQRGIRALPCDVIAQADSTKAIEWFRFAAVDQAELPPVAEQFVRGDQLHLNFPQGEGMYGLRLAIRPVRSSAEYLAIETTISIQTTLLDTHPQLDVIVPADEARTLNLGDLPNAGGAPPVTIASSSETVAVLLGPHDAPFTTSPSAAGAVKLRLFGDFLEKGVIRKARPWFVIDRGKKISDSALGNLWAQLSASPLPLTP